MHLHPPRQLMQTPSSKAMEDNRIKLSGHYLAQLLGSNKTWEQPLTFCGRPADPVPCLVALLLYFSRPITHWCRLQRQAQQGAPYTSPSKPLCLFRASAALQAGYSVCWKICVLNSYCVLLSGADCESRFGPAAQTWHDAVNSGLIRPKPGKGSVSSVPGG